MDVRNCFGFGNKVWYMRNGVLRTNQCAYPGSAWGSSNVRACTSLVVATTNQTTVQVTRDSHAQHTARTTAHPNVNPAHHTREAALTAQ